MSTFPKLGLTLRETGNSFLSFASRKLPEGASQTFVPHAPVVLTSGLIVQAASPATAVLGFALEAGSNGSAGAKRVPVVPAIDGITVFGNCMLPSVANETLAAADLGATRRLVLGATFISATRPGWYFEDDSNDQGVRIVSFQTDTFLPNVVDPSFAVVGDINPRVEAVVLAAIRTWT